MDQLYDAIQEAIPNWRTCIDISLKHGEPSRNFSEEIYTYTKVKRPVLQGWYNTIYVVLFNPQNFHPPNYSFLQYNLPAHIL